MALHRFQGHNSAGILAARSPPTVVSSRPHAPDALGPDLRPAPRAPRGACHAAVCACEFCLSVSFLRYDALLDSLSHHRIKVNTVKMKPPPRPPPRPFLRPRLRAGRLVTAGETAGRPSGAARHRGWPRVFTNVQSSLPVIPTRVLLLPVANGPAPR